MEVFQSNAEKKWEIEVLLPAENSLTVKEQC